MPTTNDPERDIQAIMEDSGYVQHGTITARRGSYAACTCPKTPCGGVTTGTEDPDCPEHNLNPLQYLHWAAECPGARTET